MSCSSSCCSPCHFILVLLLSFNLFIFFVLLQFIICLLLFVLSCSCWWYYNIYIFCYPQPPTLLLGLHILCNATYIRGSMKLFMCLHKEATSCPKLCNNFFSPLTTLKPYSIISNSKQLPHFILYLFSFVKL